MLVNSQKGLHKPATFHITELTGDEPHELHLCEEHAREYLTHSDENEEATPLLLES